MTVYVVIYRGTVYGVFDSREKAEEELFYDFQILEMEVK